MFITFIHSFLSSRFKQKSRKQEKKKDFMMQNKVNRQDKEEKKKIVGSNGSDTVKTLEKVSADSSDMPVVEDTPEAVQEVAASTTPGPMELKTTITVLDTSTGKGV